jgi:hypothetical protein
VLRKNGKILIVSANPDLFDFNSGTLTYTYPGVVNMGEFFKSNGFKYLSAEGGTDTSLVDFRQRFLRPIKFIASKLKLIPETMKGKAWLKKVFFGGDFVEMPVSIDFGDSCVTVSPINLNFNDNKHKVLYFIGEKK